MTPLQRAQAVKALHDALVRNPSNRKAVENLPNTIRVLRMDPELAGILAFSEFHGAVMMMQAAPDTDAPGPYPRPMQDEDLNAIWIAVQESWLPKVGREILTTAAVHVAHEHRYNPVRDWLAALTWDGHKRLDNWLEHAFGATDIAGYHASVGAKFLVGAVRRVRQPGCKFDHMLVLEGDQGIGKSRACRALFGDAWFTDDMPHDWKSKDAPMSLLGVWGVELADLEQLIRNEREVIKAFISRQADRFRKPYGRGFIVQPRQMVFIATTNDNDYLRDPSGGRRFWPVRCKFANPEWIADNRDQLWAEAAAAEELGDTTWLDNRAVEELAKLEQLARVGYDPWHDRIAGICYARTNITMDEIFDPNGLCIEIGLRGKRDVDRVAAILRLQGWERVVEWNPTYKKAQRSWKKK